VSAPTDLSDNKKVDCCSQISNLYFDGSRSQENSGARFILIDPKGKCHFMSCRLEFECNNKIIEYEALVQGLKKSIDLNVKELKFFGESDIIIRQVRNTTLQFPTLEELSTGSA
jgi:ribonuclease HI